jgi:preprotein translocase subunit YajC
VVTTSGVFGTITGEDGPNRFWLEVDDDVQIRIARVAIQNVVELDDEEDVVADDADVPADDAEDDRPPAGAAASTND